MPRWCASSAHTPVRSGSNGWSTVAGGAADAGVEPSAPRFRMPACARSGARARLRLDPRPARRRLAVNGRRWGGRALPAPRLAHPRRACARCAARRRLRLDPPTGEEAAPLAVAEAAARAAFVARFSGQERMTGVATDYRCGRSRGPPAERGSSCAWRDRRATSGPRPALRARGGNLVADSGLPIDNAQVARIRQHFRTSSSRSPSPVGAFWPDGVP